MENINNGSNANYNPEMEDEYDQSSMNEFDDQEYVTRFEATSARETPLFRHAVASSAGFKMRFSANTNTDIFGLLSKAPQQEFVTPGPKVPFSVQAASADIFSPQPHGSSIPSDLQAFFTEEERSHLESQPLDNKFHFAQHTASTVEQQYPVHDVVEESYHEVNPKFASSASPEECLTCLVQVMNSLEFKYDVRQHWQIHATGLICMEEVEFAVKIRKISSVQSITPVQIDFYHINGGELNFLRLFDVIRNQCINIDDELRNHPENKTEFWYDANVTSNDWYQLDTIPELYPGSLDVDPKNVKTLCNDLNDKHMDTRIDAAKLIKNACLSKNNRDMILQSLQPEFAVALHAMLFDEVDEIIRYAIFILNLFDDAIKRFTPTINLQDVFQIAENMENSNQIPKSKSIASSLKNKIIATNYASIPTSC